MWSLPIPKLHSSMCIHKSENMTGGKTGSPSRGINEQPAVYSNGEMYCDTCTRLCRCSWSSIYTSPSYVRYVPYIHLCICSVTTNGEGEHWNGKASNIVSWKTGSLFLIYTSTIIMSFSLGIQETFRNRIYQRWRLFPGTYSIWTIQLPSHGLTVNRLGSPRSVFWEAYVDLFKSISNVRVQMFERSCLSKRWQLLF